MRINIGAVIQHKNKILTLKRCKEDGGYWQYVTGTVEKNETLTEAVKREVFEETGFKISRVGDIIHSFTWLDKKDKECLDITFLLKARTNKVVLSEEHTDYEWLTINKAIEKMKWKNNKVALEKLKDL